MFIFLILLIVLSAIPTAMFIIALVEENFKIDELDNFKLKELVKAYLLTELVILLFSSLATMVTLFIRSLF